MKVLVLGGASYDDIIQLDMFLKPIPQTAFANHTFSAIGSTGVGKALAFKKLGYDVDFIAVIGKDSYGKLIKSELKSQGINFIPIYADFTERHTNIHNKNGDRISIFHDIPEASIINPHKYQKYIESADVIALNIKRYCKAFIPMLHHTKKPIFCDIHDYNGNELYHKDFIDVSNYVQMSSDKIIDYKGFIESLSKLGKEWVVCTHAEKGSSVFYQNKLFEIKADSIKIVDTNGAGDNFFVGFVHGFLNDYSMVDCLKIGKIVANSCIESRSITSDLLSLEYLDKKIKETIKK